MSIKPIKGTDMRIKCSERTCPCCEGLGVIETVKPKQAKTIKDYPVTAYGYTFTIPAGSIVSNVTACGNDDNYRFWQDYHAVAEKVTGYKTSIFAHDLRYCGLNIPAEYCESYPED